MKTAYSHIGLAKLCGWFGVNRQAYYQHNWRISDMSIEADLVLKKEIKMRTTVSDYLQDIIAEILRPH